MLITPSKFHEVKTGETVPRAPVSIVVLALQGSSARPMMWTGAADWLVLQNIHPMWSSMNGRQRLLLLLPLKQASDKQGAKVHPEPVQGFQFDLVFTIQHGVHLFVAKETAMIRIAIQRQARSVGKGMMGAATQCFVALVFRQGPQKLTEQIAISGRQSLSDRGGQLWIHLPLIP
jgi:hypothetical protein